MAFVSLRDKRSRAQQLVAYEPVETPEFEEVFDAAVGQVVDEEMSISAYLNMEEFDDRKRKVKQLADDGFDINKYTSITGVIDYDRIARDTGQVKTDEELFQRRNDLLARRRQYREEVFERGNGMAQFFGMATGFMLDPINIATLPVATAGVSLKSLGTLGAAMTVAKREAALATASELGIQAFVYQHKHDINSPYSAGDAIANIAMAATGAAVVGGITGGLSGYFGRVREAALDNADIKPNSPEALAVEQLQRMEGTIRMAKESGEIDIPDFAQIRQEFLEEVRADLTAKAGNKLDRGQRKQIAAELADLEGRLGRVTEEIEPVTPRKGVPARQAKREAVEAGQRIAAEERKIIQDRIDILSRQLDADKIASEAEADLTRISQDVIPETYQRRLDELRLQREVEADVNFLREYESRLETYNEPSRKAENYVQPQPQKAAPASVTARERDILERNGWAEDYDADIQAFKNLETKQLVVDGEVVDAEQIMKELDDEIEGINSVLECALG
jgi:hypothetical protein